MSYGGVFGADKGASAESVLYRLREFAQHHLQGKQNAMKSGKLMNALGFKADGTNKTMRKVAKLLLREEKMALISGPSGFYVALTIEELNEYLQNLEARRKGLQESEKAVRDIRDEWLEKTRGELF